MGSERPFQLEGLRVDPMAGEISGPGGREKLDPKVMDVLVHMAGNAGQVISREELHGRIWPGAVVTDNALNRCFYELRRQLGLAGGDDRYRELIETLPKRGYRLNGTVTPLPVESEAQPPAHSWNRLLAIVAGIIVAVAIAVFVAKRYGEERAVVADSIAVLPFVDMSAAQDQAYLADGISEEILNRLAHRDDLRVIARTSSFAFRDKPLGVGAIGAKLGVTHVLEGSIRKSGDRIRVTAQLIQASDNSHAWSATYDRDLGDILAIQDDIAAAVTSALELELADGTPSAGTAVDSAAFDHFLRGNFFYTRRAPGDIDLAAKSYEEALAIDPDFARAWAALSGVYAYLASEGERPDLSFQEKQGRAALRAVEIDPGLAVAHARLAQYYFGKQQVDKGVEHQRRSRELDPDDPLVLNFASGEAMDRGDAAAAIALLRQVIALDPLAATWRNNLALMLSFDGQYDAALAEFRAAIDLNPADHGAQLEIVRILILKDQLGAAEKALPQLPPGKLRDHGTALLFRSPGRRTDAEAALDRLAADPVEIVDSVRLADVYAWRGMHDQAFETLLDCLKSTESRKVRPELYVQDLKREANLSPFLKPLKSDPRWAALALQPE